MAFCQAGGRLGRRQLLDELTDILAFTKPANIDCVLTGNDSNTLQPPERQGGWCAT